MPPTPFSIAIPDVAVTDLKARLSQTRWPAEITEGGWTYGTNLAYLQELLLVALLLKEHCSSIKETF